MDVLEGDLLRSEEGSDYLKPLRIRGSGGGGGKGKGGGGGKDASNTLRSKARVRMIEAISEGVIEGLVDGEKSIYFEQTPLQNADGTYNFKNVLVTEHKGLPDEGHFPGHAGVETPYNVEVQVQQKVGPVQRTIADANADAVRVLLRIPALFYQDKKKGEMKAASLSYRIQVRAYNGSWNTVVTKDIKNEKCTSPYQIAHRIELPLNGAPWDVRVERITPDSDKIELQNELYWEGYVVIVDGKYIYPHTAAVAIEANGEDMGQSVPARSFRVRGIKVQIPSNYNPRTRQYTGIWDGTFKTDWTDSPPWIFFDLITNDRYGLGEFIRPEIVDKWSLYTIAQYCDQLVPSGYKNGETGEMIMEPRFTYNGVINTREEAYHVLQSVTTAWRGMAYWSLGQVFAAADIPTDPVKIVTPSNVIGGEFNYSGTAMKARHSVVLVQWNDPDDFYRPAVEAVINDEMLRRYGWREKSVTFEGCTSRGLAHRYGKWILDTEQNENETVEYQASWDHAEVRPGEIVAIADPAKALVRAGGRIITHNRANKSVTLDAPFEATPGETYSLMVASANGKVETQPIVSWLSDREAVLAKDYPEQIAPDAMYAVTGTDIRPRQFRVLSVTEEEKNIFKVTALFHDPLKYARVEQGIIFDPLPYTRPKNEAYQPENLSVKETFYQLNGVQHSRIIFSWTPSPVAMSRSFDVRITTPFDGEIEWGETEKTWVEINNVTPGPYVFEVRARNMVQKPSDWASFEYEAVGPAGMRLPTVTNIRLKDRPGNEFVSRDINIQWDNNFASSSDPTAEGGMLSNEWSPFYKHNTVKIWDVKSGELMREARAYAPEFIYTFDMNKADATAKGFPSARRAIRFEITVTDTFDRDSVAVTNTFTNPAPAAEIPAFYEAAEQIFFSFKADKQDSDFAGYLVWVESVSGYDPLTTNPKIDTTDTNVVTPAEPLTTYYCRFSAYDAFGKEDLNLSPEVQIVTTRGSADFDPPGKPGKPTLTSVLTTDGVKFTATWAANTEEDMAGYDVEIRQGTGAWISSLTSTTRAEWRVLPNTAFSVRVRAYDISGNRSVYSDTTTHTTVKKTTPPAPPTNVSALAGLDSIWLRWTNPTDPDLSHVIVYEGTTNVFSDAEAIATVTGSSYTRSSLAFNAERFYWLVAVDTSGNASVASSRVSAITGDIPESVDLTITGLFFKPGVEAANRLTWTTGVIAAGVPGETPALANVVAGSSNWTSGTQYIYWKPGTTTLAVAANIQSVYTNKGIIIGVYKGGVDFQLVGGKAMVNGNDILAQTIGANQLVSDSAIITGSAQIAEAIISTAHILDLSAEVLKAGTALAGTLLVGDNGDSLATIKDRAANPADRVNQGSTLIEPGKIKIGANGNLTNWMKGGNSAEIDGGAIAANSLKANTAVIGMRGITVDGITFEHNKPAVNNISWTAGTIAYTNDSNQSVTVNITAGSAVWTSGTQYLYWVKGETVLRATTVFATANGENNVILATYKGTIWLFPNYGRTIIDGGQLKAQSIDTDQLKAGAVKAGNISVTTLSAITQDVGVLTAGLIRSWDSRMQIDLNNVRILMAD